MHASPLAVSLEELFHKTFRKPDVPALPLPLRLSLHRRPIAEAPTPFLPLLCAFGPRGRIPHFTMSPTYTMSHHLWSQIYTSWRQSRQAPPDATSSGMPSPTLSVGSSYFQRSTSPKNSIDSDRGDSTHQEPASLSRWKPK